MTADIANCETCLNDFVQTAAGGQECERCIAAGLAVYEIKSYSIEHYTAMLELGDRLCRS